MRRSGRPCFAAEAMASGGDTSGIEKRVLRVISLFVGEGETRGVSFAYLSMAYVADLLGEVEDSYAAAEMAYQKDGSWTGPVIWLARSALRRGDVPSALRLLRSLPNPAADAYNMRQALSLVEARGIPVAVVLRDLQLAEAPADDEVVSQLQALLAKHPQYTPARATLAWKHLSLGDLQAAKEQLAAMVDVAADGQSIAALRVGLQIYEELNLVEETATGVPGTGREEEDTLGGEPVAARATKKEVPTAEMTTPKADEALPRESDKRTGFAGQISLFGIPDLIQFFCNSRRTGIIGFSSQQGDAKVCLHEGSIYWAESPTHPDVVEFLFDRGAIDVQPAASPRDPMGTIGMLSEVSAHEQANIGKMRESLRELVHVTLKELMEWADGWFMFDGIRDAATPRPELLLNAQGVLLDVLREMDEAARLILTSAPSSQGEE